MWYWYLSLQYLKSSEIAGDEERFKCVRCFQDDLWQKIFEESKSSHRRQNVSWGLSDRKEVSPQKVFTCCEKRFHPNKLMVGRVVNISILRVRFSIDVSKADNSSLLSGSTSQIHLSQICLTWWNSPSWEGEKRYDNVQLLSATSKK